MFVFVSYYKLSQKMWYEEMCGLIKFIHYDNRFIYYDNKDNLEQLLLVFSL